LSDSAKKFRLLRREKDPKFNIDKLEHYNLLLQVGFSDFQLCVIDSRKNKILLLEDYVMPDVTSQVERVECLKLIFHDHHLLLAGFWNRVKVMVKNRKFSLIPSKLFLNDNMADYLRVNSRLDEGQESYFSKNHNTLSLVNVYAINSNVVDFIRKTYITLEVEFHHQSSAFIQGFENHLEKESSSVLCINLDRFMLQLSLIQRGKFKYFNQFPVREFNDYLKYISMVVQEFKLNITFDKFFIWGYLGKTSGHFQQLKKKIPNLQFGKRPQGIKFGYVFDEVPDHQYFDLLSFNHLSN